MAEFEEQTFHVVKIEGPVRNDLGEMTGQELYGYLGTRLGEDRAAALVSELEQKGSAKVSYKESFGLEASFEIQRAA